MSAPIPSPQPRIVVDAFQSVGKAAAFLGSLLTVLVGYGVLTAVQGDALTGLLGAIPGLITAVTVTVQAFQVRRAALDVEQQVTPSESPAVAVNGSLVSLVPDPDQYAAAVEHGRHAA